MLQILDCTIRDGGYYNGWDFDESLVDAYIKATNVLPVDYVEIGYRSKMMKEYLGEYFYCPAFTMERIRQQSTKKIAIMLNEKDIDKHNLEVLIAPCKGNVDMMRIAVDPKNIKSAIQLAELIKKQGYEIGFNVMYMSGWKAQTDFINELSNLDGLADYLYMVDSYGGVYPDDVRAITATVRSKTNVALGFHGHNNLELALVNTLTAIEEGATIVDATVMGMGRGAGNLKTELLFTVLNQKNGLDVDFNALGSLTDQFKNLLQEYNWGTNLPYMISGANSLPQKDVMDWVTKRYYSLNSIIRALQNKKNAVADNQKLPLFEPDETYTKAVIIGGGPNGTAHAGAVKQYLEKEKDACIIHASSKNAIHYSGLENRQYFCLVGNEGHRLEKVFLDLTDFSGVCILPPFPRKMGTYIPEAVQGESFELPEISFTNLLNDSHTVLALQTAILLGVKEIALVGYDGYLQGSITQLEKSLSEENDTLFEDFKKNTDISLYSFTNTSYKTVDVTSIYARVS